MVFKGLETVRTDWTPLAQQFQQSLYLRIFKQQPYQEYIRETVRQLLEGELDSQLVYSKRLRRPLGDYQRNVPPHVRAARIADEQNLKLARPLQYQNGGRIKYVMATSGRNPLRCASRRWIMSITSPSSSSRWLTAFCPSRKMTLLHWLQVSWGFLTGDERATFQYHSALPEHLRIFLPGIPCRAVMLLPAITY